ncbi:unnamed protein product [Adineta steineri]|uniref:Disease resistance R13L4/SHOC-2-like LRR domain-containing protein n=1 Tax=Adineta steineri TaxID=433720 RepID=A0A814KJH1_9BILA|nr:unnamed protein product [Adineta steineri]
MVISKDVIYNSAVFPTGREIMIEANEKSILDCTKFQRDYDIIKSLPFSVLISPHVATEKTHAVMNNNNEITQLTIYKEKFIPLNVYCLKNLTSLIIHNTKFYEFNLDDQTIRTIPAEIGRLTLLSILRIYDSPVLHLPKEFENLNLLTTLTITNGYLQDLPAYIGNFSALQILELSYNNLKTLPSTFGKLIRLNRLLLDHNEIVSLPSTTSSLKSLQTVDVQSNELTSIDELNNMNQLNSLYAQNCRIKQIPKNMTIIMNLNMSYNNLEDLFGINSLGGSYTYLKNFDFSYNQIDIVPPQISQSILYIQKLSLKHNRLTHLPREICGQQNVPTSFLDISENLFPNDELDSIKATFRSSRPNVKVTY